MRTRCPQCRNLYHWTLTGCPRCLHANGNHPAIAFCKVLAVVALVAAIFFIVRIVSTNGDGSAGSVTPMPGNEPSQLHIFSTPVPEPARDLTFSR